MNDKITTNVDGYSFAMNSRFRMQILAFLFAFALFFPPFDAILGNLGAAFVNVGLIILGLIFVCWNGLTIRFYHKNEAYMFLLLILAMVYNVVSMFLNQHINIQKISFRDITEYYRPVLYTVSLILPTILIHKRKEFDFVMRVLLVLLVGMFLVSLGQLVGLAKFYGGLYTKLKNYDGMRVTIPFVSPYDYAYFLNFYLAYFVFQFLQTKKIRVIIYSFIPAILIIFTQSRGGFLGTIISLVFVIPTILCLKYFKQILLFKLNRHFLLLIMMAGLIVFSGGAALYTLKDGPLKYLWSVKTILTSASSGKQTRSVSVRTEQIKYAMDEALKNPYVAFFGKGSLKNEGVLLESIYAYYGNRYGIIGFMVLLIFPLFVGVWHAYLNTLGDYNPVFWQAVCAWFLLLPVIGVTNNLNEQMRLSFFYYFFIGMSIRGYYLRFSPVPTNVD